MDQTLRALISTFVIGLGLCGAAFARSGDSLTETVIQNLIDAGVDQSTMNVSVDNAGIVTVFGTFGDELIEAKAEEIIRATPGVTEIRSSATLARRTPSTGS